MDSGGIPIKGVARSLMIYLAWREPLYFPTTRSTEPVAKMHWFDMLSLVIFFKEELMDFFFV